MRIDWPDPAPEPDAARMDRPQKAPDDPNAAGKDQGEVAGGDGRPDSSPRSLDSSLRTERAAAYRAAVDVAYRQHDVQTGARGPASGREFDPEAAGGPIRQLDAQKAIITSEGVQEVAAHLRRFTGGGSLDAPERGMLGRLTSIAAGDMEPTSYDLNFFTHELNEAGRYAQLGFGPESGVDLGSSEMYEVWNDVHTAALEEYGISDAGLFHPGLAS